MSRIGNKPVEIPTGVTVAVENGGHRVSAKGPKGQITADYHSRIDIAIDGSQVVLSRPNNQRQSRELHGLTRALVANQITGVEKGFVRALEIHGTGYSAEVKNKKLVLNIGFCHLIEIEVPEGLSIVVTKGKPIVLSLSGVCKQSVGQLAAKIRAVRPPDPYKQKGIRYAGEYILKKEGKAFGKK